MSEYSDAAIHFEAVKIAMSQDKNGIVLKLSIHPNECPPTLHTDWVGSRYMVALVKLADDDTPAVTPKMTGDKVVKMAGMLCTDPNFVQWLHDNVATQREAADYTQNDEEFAKQILYRVLHIASRRELADNKKAREGFLALVDQFRSET